MEFALMLKKRYEKVLKTIFDNLEFKVENQNPIEESVYLKLGKRLYVVMYYVHATSKFPHKLEYFLNYRNYLFKTLMKCGLKDRIEKEAARRWL
jgi:hypothetical protein